MIISKKKKYFFKGIDDQLVRYLADNTLQEEASRFKLEENFNDQNYEWNPNGIARYPKLFSFDDLLIQLQRLFRLIFVADIRYFLCYLLLQGICVGFVCYTSYEDMIKSRGCHIVSMEQFNHTCNEKLKESLIDGSFMIYQLAMAITTTLVSIGLSSILVVELSSVFCNEHKNGKYCIVSEIFIKR